MEKNFSEMTDEELLVEKEELKKAKIFHALYIGFLAGILIFGIVSWGMSSQKHWGFLIPMLIPIAFIYRLIKNPNKNKDLEEFIEERSLN